MDANGSIFDPRIIDDWLVIIKRIRVIRLPVIVTKLSTLNGIAV